MGCARCVERDGDGINNAVRLFLIANETIRKHLVATRLQETKKKCEFRVTREALTDKSLCELGVGFLKLLRTKFS